jgi:hypothetical protein
MLETSWGTGAMLKFMASAGLMLGEGRFGDAGAPNSQFMTPAAAQARLDQLQQDTEWLDKWAKGDSACTAEKKRLDDIIANAAIIASGQAA